MINYTGKFKVIKDIVDWINNFTNPIPDPPSADGTYTLQCTVVDGVATYSWV